MKYLLATATFAALLAATPAGAQTAYGSVVTADGVQAAPSGNWKDNFQIYGSADPAAAAQVAPTATAPQDGLSNAIQILTDADPDMTLNVNNVGTSLANVQSGGPVIDATAVPEPSTWAMMLVGFAAVGGALRSRRKATLRYA